MIADGMLDELDTYALSDFLLFSQETYFRLFALYNEDFWPLHLVALACAAAVFYLLLRGHDRSVWGLLALAWTWVAWAFHLQRYATINLAAPYFAALFALEAVLLLLLGALGGRLRSRAPSHAATAGAPPGEGTEGASSHAGAAGAGYRPAPAIARRTGTVLLTYAILLHPLTGFLAGRTWTELSIFGMAPDPTAIGTLGALLFAGGRLRWLLLLPAVAWCAASALTAYTMDSVEAAAPAAAAAVALLLSVRRKPARTDNAV